MVGGGGGGGGGGGEGCEALPISKVNIMNAPPVISII